MILMGTHPDPADDLRTALEKAIQRRQAAKLHPVVVDLRTALGDAIDRRQVAIVRAHLDGEVITDTGFRPMSEERHAAAVRAALALTDEEASR